MSRALRCVAVVLGALARGLERFTARVRRRADQAEVAALQAQAWAKVARQRRGAR